MECPRIKYFSKRSARGHLKWLSNSRYYGVIKHEDHWHVEHKANAGSTK